VPAFDCGNEMHLPVSGADAWCGLPTFVDDDRWRRWPRRSVARYRSRRRSPTDWIVPIQFETLQDRFRQWWSVTAYVPKRMMQSVLTTHRRLEWWHPSKHGRRVG
jgi:hypothetical protein